MASSPSGLLSRFIGQSVELRLKDQRLLSGKLAGHDEHMNLVLEDAQEQAGDSIRRLGHVVLRGSNVVSVNATEARLSRGRT